MLVSKFLHAVILPALLLSSVGAALATAHGGVIAPNGRAGASPAPTDGGAVEIGAPADDDVIIIDMDEVGGEFSVTVRDRAAVPLSPSSRVIKASEFEGKFSDLPSVLETVSGIDIRAMGGHGQYAESSIRAGAPMGARVYLDGVLLNSASGGAVDLGKIPLSQIKEIRVTKSVSGLRQMGAGMGGVIELFTADGKEAHGKVVSVNFEKGSFGYVKTGMLVKTVSQQFNVDMSSSDNDYPYTHDNGTTIPTLRDPDPTWDDTLLYKRNNHYRSIDAAYSLSVDIGDEHTLTQRISAGAYEQGLFSYHYKDDQSGNTGGASVVYGADYKGGLTRRLTVGAEAGIVYRRHSISDPDGRYFLGTVGRELGSDSYTADVAADARYAVTEKIHAAGIVGARFDSYSQRDKMLGDGPKMSRQEYRAGAEVGYRSPMSHTVGAGSIPALASAPNDTVGAGLAPARPSGSAPKKYSIESAVRVLCKYFIDTTTAGFDYWKTEGERSYAGYPVAEAVVRANLHPVTLQLSASASKRAPTFFERFGWGSGFVSNPDLKEETRMEADMSAAFDAGIWSASASVFAGTVDDKIKSIPNRNFVKVMNFADTRFYGAEIDVTSRFMRMFTAELGAAYLKSAITDSEYKGWIGRDEPFVPEFSAFLKTEADIRKLTLGHGVRYESECYVSMENTVKKEQQYELCAWAFYKIKDMLTLRYRVENYLNKANFDFLDNPKPRRSHVFSLSLNL